MNHIIIIRAYQPSDETSCKELLRESIKSSQGAAFRTLMHNEITFQLMILFTAVLFIFFGVPLAACILVIPVVLVLVYVGTYISIAIKVAEINQGDISRVYMSNSFTCFWVAEAYQPYLMANNPKKIYYTVLSEQEYRRKNINVSLQSHKIVGAVGLCKSHILNEGAWLKRLCVHPLYIEKGIEEYLIKVAIAFAISQGYSCLNTQMPAYNERMKQLCIKMGFELKQIFHKRIMGSLITLLMYELTYHIGRNYSDGRIMYLTMEESA